MEKEFMSNKDSKLHSYEKKDIKTINISFFPHSAPLKNSTGLQQTPKIEQITKPGSIILW